MTPTLEIRESGIAAGLGWALAVWSGAFALNTVLAADRLTSPQWQALMTVPGGKWFWTVLFGGAGITLAIGLTRTWYWVRALGLGLIGGGCFGIAAFYMLAPLFHVGPITLGYWPWLIPVGLGIVGAVVNWRPIPWF